MAAPLIAAAAGGLRGLLGGAGRGAMSRVGSAAQFLNNLPQGPSEKTATALNAGQEVINRLYVSAGMSGNRVGQSAALDHPWAGAPAPSPPGPANLAPISLGKGKESGPPEPPNPFKDMPAPPEDPSPGSVNPFK